MRRIILFATLLSAGAVFATGATAQQYKWVDKDGKTQYGDFPPPGVKATPMRAPPGPATPPPAQKSVADRAAEDRKKAAEAAKARDKQELVDKDAEIRKRNCESAQANLRGLEVGRVRRMDSKGEYVFLDESQIAKEMAETRKAVADWCK
jgi:hypothetical protein